MKVISYNKYKFLIDNLPENKLNESSEFAQSQMNQVSSPLGPGYGFASDPTMSIYSDGSSPYVDNYARLSQIVADIGRVMKELQGYTSTTMQNRLDYFLEDVEEYKGLRILRIFDNTSLSLDVFISFDFMEEEFFGVYRKFNGLDHPKLDSDLLTDPRFNYMDKEYYIKLNNYIYKILYNWFIPTPGDYKVLADELRVKDSMGNIIYIKKDSKVYVKGYNTDQNNKPFIILKWKTEMYEITDNNYFYFKYRTEPID